MINIDFVDYNDEKKEGKKNTQKIILSSYNMSLNKHSDPITLICMHNPVFIVIILNNLLHQVKNIHNNDYKVFDN